MSKFIGRLVNVGIAKETTRGTAVDPVFWIPKMELNHDDKIQQVIDESSCGVIEDAVGASITQKFSEGSLGGRILNESFGLWLLATLGTDTVSEPEAGVVYEHTFSVLQSVSHPSLTISAKDPNSGDGLQYVLSMIDTLEINSELNDYVRFTAGFRGNSSAVAGGALTPSCSSQNFFLPQHGEFKVADNLAGLDAANEVLVKRMNLTISKNLEDDQVIGNVEVADRLNKQLAVEGSIELLYKDRNFIDTIMLSDLQKAMRLRWTSDQTIGASSNPTLTIDLAKIKLSEVARTIDNDDFVRQTLTFKSFYSLSDSKSIEIVLRNLTASY